MISDNIKKLNSTGFFHIFGGNIINKALSFLSSIVIVRILSKNEYGIFTYAWNIYCFIILFNGFGLSQGALQFGSENWNNDNCECFFTYAIRKGIIIDLLLIPLFLGGAVFFPVKIQEARRLLIIMCFLPLFQYMQDIGFNYLRVKRENKVYAKLSILSTALMLFFSICGSIVFREIGLIVGRYLAWAIISYIVFSYARLELKSDHEGIDSSKKRALIKLSAVSMLNNGISQLLYLLDIFILGIVFADEEILASYKVATTIPTALLFIPVAIVTYIYPYFASHSEDKGWIMKNYKKLFRYNFILNFFITFIFVIFAPWLIPFLFGKRYTDAIIIFQLLCLSYFISSSFRMISSNLLVMMKKLSFNFFEALICGVVNIIADVYFIRAFGSIGAAVATIIVVSLSGLMSTCYLLYVLHKKEK